MPDLTGLLTVWSGKITNNEKIIYQPITGVNLLGLIKERVEP
jgi:hypothetical protein